MTAMGSIASALDRLVRDKAELVAQIVKLEEDVRYYKNEWENACERATANEHWAREYPKLYCQADKLENTLKSYAGMPMHVEDGTEYVYDSNCFQRDQGKQAREALQSYQSWKENGELIKIIERAEKNKDSLPHIKIKDKG